MKIFPLVNESRILADNHHFWKELSRTVLHHILKEIFPP
uniref:Uncharacterized protein n=1 Tax=Setaria italica TaxID=4555 RepID=K3YKT0_SETIT